MAKGFGVTFALMILLLSVSWAEESTEGSKDVKELEEIVVVGKKIITPTKESAETVYSGMEITREGIDLAGQKGSQSLWDVVSILPGVVFESPDPGNLASTQAGVRIRGVGGSLGSMSVEGIPIYGGNPIGPRSYILDMENFESVAVYKGVAPADLGTGAGTRGGTFELRPRWAQDELGFTVNQTFGMFDYMRSYARIDSGKLWDYGSKFSLSYSYAESDKWRGEGKVGPKHNVNATIVQPVGDRLSVRLWANYNNLEHHKYRSLTYAQASDLSQYRHYDYTEVLTGDPSIDWQYYDFNTLEWTNKDIYAYIDYKIFDDWKLTLKPYYREEEKKELAGSQSISGPGGSKPGVQESGWTVERKGIIGEISGEFRNIRSLAGFQYENSSWVDSATSNYWLNPDGSLTFVGWGRYTESKGSSPKYSPYAKLAGTIDKFNWQVALKYLEMKESENEGYITKYDSQGNPYLAREPKMDYGARTYTAWLPTFGLSYSFSDEIEGYSSFGMTFQQPYAYMPLINLYYALYNKFSKMGITLEDLFEEYKPEKTYNLDIGLRIRNPHFELYPTFFLSKHENLNTTITPGWMDPDNPTQPLLYQGKPVSYATFVGKAKGYGFELGSNVMITDNFIFFFNPAYTILEYDGDIVSGGKRYETDGKQVTNVPKLTVTSGVIMKFGDLEIMPVLRWVGARYGDVAFQEKMPHYTVVDLKGSYDFGKVWLFDQVKASLEIYNLLDEKYFVSGYYPGAPFTVFGSVKVSF